jgi:hypothetical protein
LFYSAAPDLKTINATPQWVLLPPVQTLVASSIFAAGKNANKFGYQLQKTVDPFGSAIFCSLRQI